MIYTARPHNRCDFVAKWIDCLLLSRVCVGSNPDVIGKIKMILIESIDNIL